MGKIVPRMAVVVFAAVLLAARTVRLAPEHEPAILFGLTNLSSETETLLTVAVNGTEKKDYESQRKNQYAALIGNAQALLGLISSRPKPNPALLRWLGISRADDAQKDAA